MVYLNIQKCVEKIGNRFDLVLIASYRARQIQFFSKDTVLDSSKNDKPTILALREIENNLINKSILDLIFIKN